ncbi:anthranilate synthase component I family protein [Echinicola sediminis]
MNHEHLKEYPLVTGLLKKTLQWACHNFPYVSYFNPNDIPYPNNGFSHMLYAGTTTVNWNDLDSHPGPKSGIFSYDLKNKFERLHSKNPSLVSCPETLFFLPEITLFFNEKSICIDHPKHAEIIQHILATEQLSQQQKVHPIRFHTSKEEYIQNVRHIQDHIREGDIYEMNYCMAFSAAFDYLDPIETYWKLLDKSPMPFSCFFKAKSHYLVGASPERFLKKKGKKIIAQPIKGTIKRGSSPEEDLRLMEQLKKSEKEQAENLMIVDLMRNDLSWISDPGSVKVDELFGIYPFRQVSQMISTVSSTLKPTASFDRIISHTFPMGSMTGAPKIKCMELIEHYENFKRGWFSGAVGYLSDEGDFDFSVIIRSIVIDQETNKLYFAAGSAITYDADPEYEYEECLLKANAILSLFQEN